MPNISSNGTFSLNNSVGIGGMIGGVGSGGIAKLLQAAKIVNAESVRLNDIASVGCLRMLGLLILKRI